MPLCRIDVASTNLGRQIGRTLMHKLAPSQTDARIGKSPEIRQPTLAPNLPESLSSACYTHSIGIPVSRSSPPSRLTILLRTNPLGRDRGLDMTNGAVPTWGLGYTGTGRLTKRLVMGNSLLEKVKDVIAGELVE
ncbi:unnamed protein product [Rhizoctonia solani]|uniref:Uncharacterized protein n=1 Tax=Rhizoctonia solani TaxID=456999 RepID=A0A8H2WM07_9AGAM|nr:unnamed protein product [Rhizoctonia solani]